jgi:RNA polymerase sigma-70 factor, ECF subfamily
MTRADEMRLTARVAGSVEVAGHDDSRDWVAALRGPPACRAEALAELHTLLLRGARFELMRRRDLLGDVPQGELDGLAVEAASDALVAILAKLDSFRAASRFTTWAYKFVLREAGARARREAWRGREMSLAVEVPETLGALRDAVHQSLTPHQRDVFAALVLNDVPIDVLAERLGTTRGALHATLHDARRTLRPAMVEAGP